MTPPETYSSASELMKLNAGWTRKDLAEYLGKSQATITLWLSPDELIPEARQAFLDCKFGFTKSYAIAKLTRDEQPGLLALTLSGATRDALERHGRKTRAAGKTVARTSKIRCPLVSGPTVTVAGEEISLDDAIEALKEAAKAMQKARDTGLDASTAQRVWADMAKAGC